jgi:hypothetical protein
VRTDFHGRASRSPFATAILEITDQFLLFSVHRDYRLAASLIPVHLLVDVVELGIAISVVATFTGLAIRWQAVTELSSPFKVSIHPLSSLAVET